MNTGTPRAARVLTFCSTSDNIGRTTALINVALVLAESGQKVLIVDAHPSAIRARDYLRPYLPADDPTDNPAHNPDHNPAGVVRLRYGPADSPGRVDLLHIDDITRDITRLTDLITVEQGDASADHDFVLIDAPNGAAAPAPPVSGLTDVVVACFPLNARAIEGAAAMADHIRRDATRPVTVVALGIKADEAARKALGLVRSIAEERFARFAVDGKPHYAEIPYHPQYAFTETLAVATEPHGETGGLRPAYERLARRLSDGKLGPLRRVTVCYVPRFRVWAEWAAGQLGRLGVRVRTIRWDRYSGESPAPGSATIVFSPAGLDAESASRLRGMATADLRLAVVDDLPVPDELSGIPRITLHGLTEPEAVTALRRDLAIGGPSIGGVSARGVPIGPRFPGNPPEVGRLRHRARFVGRDDFLEEVRDALHAVDGSGHRPCLISGEPGMGKSMLAMEYAARFAPAYDIVWWLPGEGEQGIREGLARLAHALRIPTGADASQAALRHLSSDDAKRWLLVYDNVEKIANLPDLLPEVGTDRHVIVVSRTADVLPAARELPLTPFTRTEATAVLAAKDARFLSRYAEQVADRVRHIPLLVDLAGAWVTAFAFRLEQGNTAPQDALANAVARFTDEFDRIRGELQNRYGVAPLARVMLELALETLPADIGGEALRRENIGGEATIWLLEACALLSPLGVSRRLLKSRATLAELPLARQGLRDPLMVDVMLRSLQRYGLARVEFDGKRQPVLLHRLLAELLRERMGDRLGPRVEELRGVLAAYAPADPDDAQDEKSRRMYAELDLHLDALEPWRDERRTVRQWVINQMDWLLGRGEKIARERARTIGLRAEESWAAAQYDRELYLRLLNLLGRAFRELGDYQDTERYSRNALRSQREVLGKNHPRTLLTAGAYAAALRGLGRFEEARAEDRAVLRALGELLGPNHPNTGEAMHNLAISEALMGDVPRALELAKRRFALRVAAAGENDPAAWRTATMIARFHRDLGDNDESYELLKQALNHQGSSGLRTGDGPGMEVLRAESGLAITERRLGRPYQARERDERTLRDLHAHHGDRFLLSIACAASLAADLHALGKHDEAVSQAVECLGLLKDTLGDTHPYTHICQVNLAVYLRASGDLPEALRRGEESLEALSIDLGWSHPWTLASAVNLANTLVAAGEPERAADLERQAHAGYRGSAMPNHPNLNLIARNLEDTTERMAGRREGPASSARSDIDLEIPGL
ncbi:FxSxx-COOH system tetratricopeptide repeat protein [Thermopolyspora sp. NPDC052614]|uniref:FxSxx-COOH system tetratricopeptide repeat protein n=1 Tax=Thermopolyspora sp. NPDC052614 TaxID=3155682 RepID=UPI0034382049